MRPENPTPDRERPAPLVRRVEYRDVPTYGSSADIDAEDRRRGGVNA